MFDENGNLLRNARNATRGYSYEKSVMNNPLDYIMQRYAGQAVTPESILLDYPNFSDLFEVEDRLKEWVRRNKDDCQVLHANPYMVKVFVTPHDIDVYNKNIHRKHQEARRLR